jgi:hypothetical protein
MSEIAWFRQLQPVALAAVPQKQAFRGTNLDDVCARIADAEGLGKNCDVVLGLSDPDPRFFRSLLSRGGAFLRLATMLCCCEPKSVKN